MMSNDKEFNMQNEDSPPIPSSASYSQGMHNVQSGSVNMANMGATSPSRNTMLSSIPSSGIQPPSGNVTNGRSAASNVPIPRSQVSHGSSHGYSAATNRGVTGIPGRPGYSSNKNSVGGSIPGIIPTSSSAANWSSKLGLGVSPIQCNAGDRIHSSMGKMAGGGNIEGSISSSGGLSRPGLGSWSNTIGSGGVGSSSGQAQNKLPGEVLQQASPVVMSTSGNSYPDGAQAPQPQSQISLTSMGMLGDVNNNERSIFDPKDFPQLSREVQRRKGSLRKHGKSPIVQPDQGSSIQNKDFKGGNADYSMNSHQKEQLPETMMQSPQQNHSQSQLQQMNAISTPSGDQNVKSLPLTQSTPEPFGLLSLASHIQSFDPDWSPHGLFGMDVDNLGINFNSTEKAYKTFGGPFSDKPLTEEQYFSVPQSYSAEHLTLQRGHYTKFSIDTLFYIFYSVPKDEAQLDAANELRNRGWFYLEDHRLWFTRVPNTELLVKTNTYEKGSYLCFDPIIFETVRKDNFVVRY